MTRFGVVADDLTGGCDTGVQFGSVGLTTRLCLSESDADVEADVVVITTDSRGLDPRDASDRVRRAVRRLRGRGAEKLYKKIDSTGRGHLAAEVFAMLDECEAGTLAVICPAYAPLGRTVVNGSILVHEKPAHRTASGRDPVHPLLTSSIPEMLAPLGSVVKQVPLTTVKRGADAIRSALRGLPLGTFAVVMDATSEANLGNVAQAIEELDRPVLPVGSAGLARALAPHWVSNERLAPATPCDTRHPESPMSGVVLVAVGSLHATSRRQSERLSEGLRWPTFVIDLEAARRDRSAWEASLDNLSEQSVKAARNATGLVLTTPTEVETRSPGVRCGETHGQSGAAEEATWAARFLADAAVELCARIPVSGLVLTGGDSARAVMRAMEATSLLLTGEVAPGIPAGRVAGGRFAGVDVVTKSGGFGDPDGLLLAAQYIQRVQGGRMRSQPFGTVDRRAGREEDT